MASEDSTRLQFPTHQGKPLYSARVGRARVLAAQAVKKDWERLTTALRHLQEGQPSDAVVSPPTLEKLAAEGPQPQSQERPDVLKPPPKAFSRTPGATKPSIAETVPKIGIVGVGSAGLFTAKILKWLKANAVDGDGNPFNYTCEIIEASSEVGGRLNTHSFDETQQDLYFDVGAMRYPENNVMTRYAQCYIFSLGH